MDYSFSQLLLLLLFSQGRADYYASPLILLTYLSSEINLSKVNIAFHKLFAVNTLIQFVIISAFISISIFQNFCTFINYRYYMNETAYGFSSSEILKTVNMVIF